MKRSVAIEVPGTPVAQPRHQITLRGKYIPTLRHGQPHPIHGYRVAVGVAAHDLLAAPLEGPLTMQVDFIFPRPARVVWKTKAMVRLSHVGRPDLSNLIKGVEDALNGIAYKDDSQIVFLQSHKWYAAGCENPHTWIFIQEQTNGGPT